MGQERTTISLLEQIELALHRHLDAETAELVDTIRERWMGLAREKTYWKCRCGKYENALDRFAERYSGKKMPPPAKGAGDSVNLG